MIILKGDIVRTSSGMVGEVIEVWGLARTFLKIKPDSGRKKIVFETDVSELIKRPKSPPRGRG